jgi:hypothetical protein
MASLSPAAGLAWQIAASEAATCRHPFIEREHLLIGVCSLQKALGFLQFSKLESFPVEPIRTEAEGVDQVLGAMGISVVSFRRGVRSRLRPGLAQPSGHRHGHHHDLAEICRQ